MTTEHTNANGVRFYIEPAMDFDRQGNMFETGSVFAGRIDGSGNHEKGYWFPDAPSAEANAATWEA